MLVVIDIAGGLPFMTTAVKRAAPAAAFADEKLTVYHYTLVTLHSQDRKPYPLLPGGPCNPNFTLRSSFLMEVPQVAGLEPLMRLYFRGSMNSVRSICTTDASPHAHAFAKFCLGRSGVDATCLSETSSFGPWYLHTQNARQ